MAKEECEEQFSKGGNCWKIGISLCSRHRNETAVLTLLISDHQPRPETHANVNRDAVFPSQ
jgi:hypothetical protein